MNTATPYVYLNNLPPITSAPIHLAPLTCFYGEANTGKTTLCRVIYALHQHFHGFTHIANAIPNAYPTEPDALQIYKLPYRVQTRFLREMQMRESLVTTFKQNAIDIDDLTSLSCGIRNDTGTVWEYITSLKKTTFDITLDVAFPLDATPLCHYPPDAVFLQYETLLQHRPTDAHDCFSIALEQTAFGLRFIQKTGAIADVANALETDILEGTLHVHPSEKGYPQFRYLPDGMGKPLKLTEASSTVCRLAPLLFYLRYIVKAGDTLILDAPTAGLYPDTELKFARTMAGLIRAGIRIVLVTQSTWLISELANLIREGLLLEKNALPSSLLNSERPPSWLLPTDINVYHFIQGENVKVISFSNLHGLSDIYFDIAHAEAEYERTRELTEACKRHFFSS